MVGALGPSGQVQNDKVLAKHLFKSPGNSSNAEWGKQDVTVRRGINVTLVLPGRQRRTVADFLYSPPHLFVLFGFVGVGRIVSSAREPSRLEIGRSKAMSVEPGAVNR